MQFQKNVVYKITPGGRGSIASSTPSIFKQLRPKVANNYTCMSQTEDFDTLYIEEKYQIKKIIRTLVGCGGVRKTYCDGTSQKHRTDAILMSIHTLRTRTK